MEQYTSEELGQELLTCASILLEEPDTIDTSFPFEYKGEKFGFTVWRDTSED